MWPVGSTGLLSLVCACLENGQFVMLRKMLPLLITAGRENPGGTEPY